VTWDVILPSLRARRCLPCPYAVRTTCLCLLLPTLFFRLLLEALPPGVVATACDAAGSWAFCAGLRAGRLPSSSRIHTCDRRSDQTLPFGLVVFRASCLPARRAWCSVVSPLFSSADLPALTCIHHRRVRATLPVRVFIPAWLSSRPGNTPAFRGILLCCSPAHATLSPACPTSCRADGWRAGRDVATNGSDHS